MKIDFTIPSQLTANELGKVNVHNAGEEIQVECTILMEPEGQKAEGWQTGVALDASASMQGWYGRKLVGEVPTSVRETYKAKGWITTTVQDNEKFSFYQREAYQDAIENGYLKHSENLVQKEARKFITYLASGLDVNGGTTLIYWACGGDGNAVEEVGDFTETDCTSLRVEGPNKKKFGLGTQLFPAVRYFVERFSDSPQGMYIFITDGRLDDLEQVKQYTTQIAQAITNKQQNPVKCVLIGVGNQIDESQMIELDDLETGTDIDIWDHKIAEGMRDLTEIFAEVVDENTIIAPMGVVYDNCGSVVKRFTDGLPARLDFSMQASSQWFELEVGDRRIRQTVTIPSEP